MKLQAYSLMLTMSLLVRAAAQTPPLPSDTIIGEWIIASGDAKVEIFKCDNQYCGRIVWIREPEKDGKVVLDDKNPDETLRSRPVLGLIILRGFEHEGDDEWKGGRVYDPKSGSDYSARLTLVDEKTLDLRGYVLMPLFGRTERWTR